MSNMPQISTPLQIEKDEDGSFSNSSCRYAKAIHESEVSSSLPGLLELRQCPVFSEECPFKSASNPQDFRHQLKRIPLGHMAKDGPLYNSLKFFHESKENPSGNKCPVRGQVSVPEEWSFHQTVEELSLISIMAEMALAIEQEDFRSVDSEGNAETSAATDSSTLSPIPSEVRDTDKYPSRPSLSDALKTGTANSHQAAEGVQFVKQFVRGKIDRELYGLMIAQLYHLYGSLEIALDRHAPALFNSCHFSNELHRRAALQEDVEFWHTNTPTISPATRDYIDRIEHLSENKPLLLLAHAYTRHLGDLSGGKVLARVAKRALLLVDDDGLAFYHFPQVKSFKLFKDKYRAICL